MTVAEQVLRPAENIINNLLTFKPLCEVQKIIAIMSTLEFQWL